MHDFTNSQMLGEVQPGDTLQGPISLANIEATLAAKRYRNMLIYGGAGLAAVLGFALITKKNRL